MQIVSLTGFEKSGPGTWDVSTGLSSGSTQLTIMYSNGNTMFIPKKIEDGKIVPYDGHGYILDGHLEPHIVVEMWLTSEHHKSGD